MHLYVIARGIVDRLNRWENDCLAQYYPYKYAKDKPLGMVQLNVRPVQLYEIVFPKESLPKVLSYLWPKSIEKKSNMLCTFLRKVLGLKRFPSMKGLKPHFQAMSRNVTVHPVGMKEDKVVDGIEQL